MKFQELPQEAQQQLNADRAKLHDKKTNTAYEIKLYNKEGTRYFSARRTAISWSNDRGGYMPFGGGTVWSIHYGVVQFRVYKMLGEKCYELSDGKCYGKAASGQMIPNQVGTKKEVLEIIKGIGIFDL